MNRRIRTPLLLLICGSSILFLMGSRLPFLGSDEPRYAEVAREMLQSRDFFVPTLGTFPWFEKPVLLYWLMDASYSLFGVNEFAARLPSVLCALATVLLITLLMARIKGIEYGIAAGSILATTALFAAYAHAAMFDMLLTFCITGVIVSFCFYKFEENRKWLYAMYAFIGVGILAKGFVTLILTAPAILACTYFGRNSRSLSELRPFRGIAIIIAIVSVWFLPVSLIYGTVFWRQFFVEQQLHRYTSENYHHAASDLYYIFILIAGTFPWTFAPFLARIDDEEKIHFVRNVSLWWFFSALLFFSFSVTKLPGYILPALPPFAVLSALCIAAYRESTKRRKLRLLFFFIVNLASILVLYRFLQNNFSYSGAFKIGLVIMTFLLATISFLLFQKKLRAVLLLNSFVSLLMLWSFVYWIAPDVRWAESKKLAQDVLPKLSKTQELMSYNVDDYIPLFYTNGQLQLNPDGRLYQLLNADRLDHYLIRHRSIWLLVDNEDLPWILKSPDWKTEMNYGGKGVSIVQLEKRKVR